MHVKLQIVNYFDKTTNKKNKIEAKKNRQNKSSCNKVKGEKWKLTLQSEF
jgi:hypothetical protein